MTLKECYAAMGADYDDVMSRLRTEERVQKFLLKILNDKSYDLLCSSIEENNLAEAFRAAHTLKGVSQNLSLTTLYQSSHELAEMLRNDPKYDAEVEAVVEQVKKDYERVISNVRLLA